MVAWLNRIATSYVVVKLHAWQALLLELVKIEDRSLKQGVIRVETRFRFPWKWILVYFGLGCITFSLWQGPLDTTIYVGTISLEGLVSTLLIGVAAAISRSVMLFRRQIWTTIDPSRLSMDFEAPPFMPSLYSGPAIIVLMSLLALGLYPILPQAILPVLLVWTLLSTTILLVTSAFPFVLADWATHFTAAYWLLRKAHDNLPYCAICAGPPKVPWPFPPTMVRDTDRAIEIYWNYDGPGATREPTLTEEEWMAELTRTAREHGVFTARMAAEEFGRDIREMRAILHKWWTDERELAEPAPTPPTYLHGKWWAPREWWQARLERTQTDSNLRPLDS